MIRRARKILITNILAVWMVNLGGTYFFRGASLEEVRRMMKDGEVVFWFSNEEAREKVKSLLGLEDVEVVDRVPGDVDCVVVIGRKGDVTVVERVKRVVPVGFS